MHHVPKHSQASVPASSSLPSNVLHSSILIHHRPSIRVWHALRKVMCFPSRAAIRWATDHHNIHDWATGNDTRANSPTGVASRAVAAQSFRVSCRSSCRQKMCTCALTPHSSLLSLEMSRCATVGDCIRRIATPDTIHDASILPTARDCGIVPHPGLTPDSFPAFDIMCTGAIFGAGKVKHHWCRDQTMCADQHIKRRV